MTVISRNMFAGQILCCLVLLLFPLHGSAERIRVDVTYSLYSNSRDEMEFYTKDTDICSKFNAKYKSKSYLYDTVTCECKYNTHSFFGINGQQMSCRDENSNLYGCSKNYATTLPEYKSTGIPKLTFYNSRCELPSYYNIQIWNGDKFASTNYSKDFKATLSTKMHSEVLIEWKNYNPDYTPYKGRLIRFGVNCAVGSFPRTLCFVMKGIGTHTFYTDHQPTYQPTSLSSSSSSSSKTGLYIGVSVGAICLIALIVTVTVICRRKRSRSQPTNSPPKQQRIQAPGHQNSSLSQEYPQPSYNPNTEISYPSSPPPEYISNQQPQTTAAVSFQPYVNQQYPMALMANQPAIITQTVMPYNQPAMITPVSLPNFQQAPMVMPAQQTQAGRQGMNLRSVSRGINAAGNVAGAMGNFIELAGMFGE